MKLLKKINLQWRITILTALILTISSVLLTSFSLFTASQMLSSTFVTDGRDFDEYSTDSTDIATNPNTYTAEPDDEADVSNYIMATQAKETFDIKGVIFCAITIILGTTAIYFISGRALKPLKKLTTQVSEIDENNLSARFEESDTKDEIQKLTVGFNRMMHRLEDAFIRQKRFTASAAHELKTPLTTMKAGMQVMKQDKNATKEDYLENIDLSINNIDRLSSVVNDLLLIAMSQENQNHTNEEIYLDIMIDTIVSDLSQAYKKNNVTFTSDLQENIIFGQSTMIYRALYNLIENAYKYNKVNGNIAVKSFSDDKNIYIKIADTGKGMEENQLPLIFDAFYRVDNSRSRKIAGAGLGLSLVKTIITNHNGTIEVSSKPDYGTTFTVALPKDNQ